MAHRRNETPTEDLDGLRLLALGRIPRCGTCPRFHALVEVHARDAEIRGSLPDVPDYCTHQVCTPLSVRFERFVHLRAS